MAGSSSCMSWTSTPARRWRSPSPAGSTPTPPSRCSTGWSPNAAPPRLVRCDNDPEFTAHALRDWCRFSGAGTSYIEPGSPWQNPYVERFGGRLRDELLAVEALSTLLEAQVLVEDWRIQYNTIPTPQRPGLPHADRVRQDLDQHPPTATLIAPGPTTGVRSGTWAPMRPSVAPCPMRRATYRVSA